MKKIGKYLIIFWISFITLGIMMGATRHIYTHGQNFKGASKSIIEFLSSYISIFIHFKDLDSPMLTENSKIKNGFSYTPDYKGSNDYILDSSWDSELKQNTIKLIRIKDGKIIHKWTPSISKIAYQFNKSKFLGFKNSMDSKNTRLLHPYLFNDGSIIIGGIYINKIDKNSNLIWQKKVYSHHSIEKDIDDNLWLCCLNTNTYIANKYNIRDDVILKINSKTGKIIFQKSIFQILKSNGFTRGQLFLNPIIHEDSKYYDYFHLNDIEPVLKDSKYWKKGDLFLDLRQLNLVLLYRPSTNKIIWQKTGDWLNQHNIDILDDSKIAIFGNNITNGKYHTTSNNLIDRNNVQYIYNFNNDSISTPYTKLFSLAKIRTFTEGRSRILSNGNIFIEETNHGRLLFGNKTKLLWTYTNRIDDNHLSKFNWCRYITEDEFKKFTFVSNK